MGSMGAGQQGSKGRGQGFHRGGMGMIPGAPMQGDASAAVMPQLPGAIQNAAAQLPSAQQAPTAAPIPAMGQPGSGAVGSNIPSAWADVYSRMMGTQPGGAAQGQVDPNAVGTPPLPQTPNVPQVPQGGQVSSMPSRVPGVNVPGQPMTSAPGSVSLTHGSGMYGDAQVPKGSFGGYSAPDASRVAANPQLAAYQAAGGDAAASAALMANVPGSGVAPPANDYFATHTNTGAPIAPNAWAGVYQGLAGAQPGGAAR